MSVLRLMTSLMVATLLAAGTAHAEAMMEFLATVGASPAGTMRGVLGALGQAGNGGAVVPIVAGVADAELAAIGRLRGRFASVTVVHFLRSSYDSSYAGDDPKLAARTPGLIRVTRERPFADAWNTALHRAGRTLATR